MIKGDDNFQNTRLEASFRDPSGFIFWHNNGLYRQVNSCYRQHYDYFIKSGLYDKLATGNLLVKHTEEALSGAVGTDAYKIIKPQYIPFISYPYEWSYSQLKDSALLILRIQKYAIAHNMTLKDCSAFNVQFLNGKPILIDTLSFEKCVEGQPWIAYRQFCQHFLAPLALMSHTDIRLNQLSQPYIDGIPLDLASSLLPKKTYLSYKLFIHIHLHARLQQSHGNKALPTKKMNFSRQAFVALINNLEKTILELKWNPTKTEWGSYYKATNYSSHSIKHKHKIIKNYIEEINPKDVWDIGGNTGLFSRIASNKGIPTISFDIDPVAIEKSYRECVKNQEKNLLPLFLDLTNPTPGIGWANKERFSLIQRGPTDTILALALIHHLAISNNVPLTMVADLFHSLCRTLIIEWIPKSDSNVKRLLATREDIFPDYTQAGFKKSFQPYFKILQEKPVKDSKRTLYLMEAIK